MNLVIDANVIFSALIRDSVSRQILKESGWKFYYPEKGLEKIEKYRNYIIKKTKLDEEGFEELLDSILDCVELISDEVFVHNFPESTRLIGHIDVEDVSYLALALSIDNDGIWSDDRHFEKQNKVRVWKTEDIIRKFLDFLEIDKMGEREDEDK